jgi:hypothetical protein
MDLPEPYAHSFIIKVWLEEIADDASPTVWRGHITHVPSGERRYLKDLDDIAAFIMPYLDRMGVEFGRWRRAGDWLRLLRTYIRRN